MPLTLPTHPVAVVPLKLAWPRRFDGLALVVGSIAPDVTYAAAGYAPTIYSHRWLAPLWWALPFTLLAVRLIRWAAPAVAVHLPGGGPLRLRDYGVLGTVRHRWPITAISAVIGAYSHLLWDWPTHWWGPVRWWGPLSDASNVVGFVAAAVLAVRIGRGGLLRRWHGPPPEITARPAVFWPPVIVVLAAGLASLPAQPAADFVAGTAIRALLIAVLALAAGAAATGIAPARAARAPAPERRPDEKW